MFVDAPTGNVTLVFTDIEGSTVLWERYGEAFKSTLDAHNAIIRQALAANHGYEVKTEGDAFFVVFSRPLDAVRFSLDVQRGLAALKLKGDDAVRVRIGLHTAEPLVELDSQGKADYFGPAVNRAARISSAGHGGQTLMSGDMVEPLREALGSACEFSDLGEHRLRGLEDLERLVQVVAADAPIKRFGPLRTLSDTPSNLPAQTTTFLGRDKELKELRAILLGDEARRTDAVGPIETLSRQPGAPDTNQVTREIVSKNRGARLITLTGPGGCGKTRLAISLASSVKSFFPGGVWFADLSDARDEQELCRFVMESLGNQLRPGKASPAQQVAWALEQTQALLVLDTFEQLSRHAHVLSLWLRTAPRLKLLVTSREVLRVEGECEYAVTPLSAPEFEERDSSTARLSTRISNFPAVQLFLERASQAKPGFVLTPQNAGAVAEICHRLDGMPLAIELAAARLSVLSPQQLAQRLEKGFDLISSRGRDKKSTRQTNLRNTIEWSYSLLDPWEKTAFLQLSYFAGSFTLESAEAVIDLTSLLENGSEPAGDAPEVMDVVFSLRDKSLLSLRGDEDRYLFEMLGLIRSFTQELFSKVAGEEFRGQLAHRHAKHFLERAEAVHKLLESPMAASMKETEAWGLLDALKAQTWAVNSGDLPLAIRLFLATTDLLGRNARFRDQREKGDAIHHSLSACQGGLEACERDPKLGKLMPKFLAALAQAHLRSQNLVEGRAVALRAIELAKRVGDTTAEGTACNQAGMIAHYLGDNVDALARLEHCLALRRKSNDRRGEAGTLANMAIIYDAMHDHERMRSLLQESVNTFVKAHDKRGESMAMNNLGVAYERLGDLSRAEDLYRGSLKIKQALHDRLGIVQCYGNLGTLSMMRLNCGAAEEFYLNALDTARQIGDRRSMMQVLMRVSLVSSVLGPARVALSRAEEASQMVTESAEPWHRTFVLSALAAARFASGDELGAQEACRELIQESEGRGDVIVQRAKVRLAACSTGRERKQILADLEQQDKIEDSDVGVFLQCLRAEDEADEQRALELRRKALARPREWQELADIACRAALKTGGAPFLTSAPPVSKK